MVAKAVYFLCACALFETISGQCIGNAYNAFADGLPYGAYGPGWAFDGVAPFDGWGYGGARPALGCGAAFGALAPAAGLAAAYGGGLAVTSASPIAPTGLTVTSENAIEGALAVIGQLPFLGAVATDGAFATAGAGAVSYGCGDGAIGITAEGPFAGWEGAAIAPAVGVAPYGYGPARAGYRNGCGCGCGAIY